MTRTHLPKGTLTTSAPSATAAREESPLRPLSGGREQEDPSDGCNVRGYHHPSPSSAESASRAPLRAHSFSEMLEVQIPLNRSDDSALALACMSATSWSMATTRQRAPRARPRALRKALAADYARPQPAHFHGEAEVVYSSAELVCRSGPVH